MDSQPHFDMQQLMHLYTGFIAIWVIFWFVKMALYIIPLWRIAKNAGLNPAISLLAAIPLIGRMLTLYILGFSDWRVAPLSPSSYAAGTYPPPYPSAPPAYIPSAQPYAPPTPPPTQEPPTGV